MSESVEVSSPVVVVTGANGFVGSRVCAALVDRGATVRAVVRRPGTAPALPGLEEHLGDFQDPELAAAVVAGADAVVTTVHPLGGDRQSQEQVAAQGTPALARAARDAGVERLVHVSTAAVYDRSPDQGDVDESAALVGDDANDYAITKRDTDLALADLDGLTRVLVRPPAILGSGETSVWNSVRPTELRDEDSERRATPQQTFAWVHVDDLVALLADLAVGAVPSAEDPDHGPVAGGCTAVNVAATETATIRDYVETVTSALGVEPAWEERPAWTGQILADRARAWGWRPKVSLTAALAELAEDVRSLH